MERAITHWLTEECTDGGAAHDLAKKVKLSYTVYGCMLLLSHNAFQSEHCKVAVARKGGDDALQTLYPHLAHHLKTTHIAITNPIPLNNDHDNGENVIRSPSNFRPLYGDFGPASANSPPTHEDFEAAFWVTAKQNRIHQTWAPRWTMFSRGNIGEKARILELDSVAQAVEQGEGCTAVDLYAGIGYFAFSYLRAGVRKVLCWDLNEWSCEGLRRGARANGWEVQTLSAGERLEAMDLSEARLLVFNESNEMASEKVRRTRSALPPIRHVNCGLLPTSRGSWQAALDVLDDEMGGWMHVHENFAVEEIEKKAEEARSAFQSMLAVKRKGTVELEHINRLKSYAPGVMHCVLDIYIPPQEPS